MRTRLIASLAILLAVSTTASAQRPAADTIPATGGDITIAPINHATLQITHGQQVITVDPTSQGTYTGLPAPTLILITDIHGDHLDPKALGGIRTASTTVVVPAAAAAQVPGAITMGNGDTRTIDGIQIEAVPMYNIERGPTAGQLYHPKGRGNGYILTIGGRRIYIAGDTECTPEMKALRNIDVAFVPMNLPYTMPPEEAAACVAAFTPRIAYPYHYRGSDLAAFEKPLEGSGVEVRLRNWY